jgi:hypothetical protein
MSGACQLYIRNENESPFLLVDIAIACDDPPTGIGDDLIPNGDVEGTINEHSPKCR